jgi:dGTPase
MLAAYAVRVEKSRGRRYPEPTHPYRNDFERDRDRVVHARAFRRLKDKTQVFTRRFSDHFRNRLTHTIEVSQIARTIAAQLGLNVDLVEALALVHDVGHPPFGHAGEKTLDAIMRQHGLAFDHNLHALRIVEDFELRYAAFRGLNLTFEVREGIIKHSHDYDEHQHPELAEYVLGQRPPLEAQLIDVADEIAYNTADLDDGYEAHLLAFDDVRSRSAMFRRFLPEVDQMYPRVIEKLRFNEVLKRMLNRMVDDLIRNTRQNLQSAEITTVEDVRKDSRRLVNFGPEVEAERLELKRFLHERLYFSPALEPEKEDAEKIIRDLFEYWVATPTALPTSYQEKAQTDPLARVVCDYIAGMTDNYIYEQYEKRLAGSKGYYAEPM